MPVNIITKYFPKLTQSQYDQFSLLFPLYSDLNEKINVISRKDMENFNERHVLHSLSIAKVQSFQPSESILDIGTGGGFPGIPLAILFPDAHFTLCDSITKKIFVVEEIVKALKLQNVKPQIGRAENITGHFDFVVTRAVAKTADLIYWSRNKHPQKIFALKGGDLKEELANIRKNIRIAELKDFFDEPFFETKKLVVIN